MQIFTGCSGFHYDDWKGTFYPDDLPKEEWLPYYARHFQTVEINNSFYQLPEAETLEKWYEQTPEEFQFSMKGSRYVTHMKKLVDDEDTRDGVKKFYDTIQPLQNKLGCILWQLPANQHRDDEKLTQFCKMLSKDFRNVIEFRHISWFKDQVFGILEHHEVSYCMVSAPENLPEEIRSTTDTGYLRLHGKKEWYRYDYTNEELTTWQQKLEELDVQNLYIYFNNDTEAHAVQNAQYIQTELHQE